MGAPGLHWWLFRSCSGQVMLQEVDGPVLFHTIDGQSFKVSGSGGRK